MRVDRRAVLASLAVAAIALLVLAENLFGRQINAIALRFPGIDKVAHICEYFLIFVALHKLAGLAGMAASRHVTVALVGSLALALLDETLQQWGPGRNVELLDVVANVCGITFGWAASGQRRALAVPAAALALAASIFVTWTTHATLNDYSIALRYEQQGDFVRAREHHLRAYAAGMRTAGLFNELSWVEIESGVGEPRKAVEYGKAALEMQPRNPDFLDTYGWALHHAGRHEEALAALLQAYEGKPRIFCIHYHLGSVYRALGRHKEAEFHFRRQVERHGTREAVLAQRALSDMTGAR